MITGYSSKRFGPDYTDQFPEVVGYDYESNLFTRGDSDSRFRWTETYIQSNYLLKEVTYDGSFELNDLSGSPSTGEAPLPNPSYNYSGWTIVGDSVYHIGISGSYISAYDKMAYPIVTNAAAMLDATGSSVYLSQTGIGTDETGMPFDKHFQVYLVARALFGTGYITPYVSSRIGGADEAYYDPFLQSWSVTQPTGTYEIPSAGYTEILYDFYTSDISGSTPDNYAINIAQYSGTSNPVIVDDVHIDEILIRNPYLDYILPTGYLVQITPDIGWHSIKDMFDSSTNQNPHLKTFGLFSAGAGNLEDKLDGSVEATIDDSDFSSALIHNYKRYLWRAVAVGPNGQIGNPGLPMYFEYIGSILDSDFTVDTIVQDPLSIVRVVKGRKPVRASILVDNIEPDSIVYPTSSSWVYTVHMDREEKNISIKARDPGGATSSVKYLKLTCKLYNTKDQPVWNVFDDHGLIMDIERLPGEPNTDFYDRIKDVIRNPGGSSFDGIVNGATRELGLDKISQALTISILQNSSLVFKKATIDLELTSRSIKVRTEFFTLSETKIVDPVYNYIILSYYPRNILEVKTEEGLVLSSRLYSIEFDNNSSFTDRRYKVVFNTNEYKGLIVKVKYEYFKEALFKDYTTLGSVLNWLNNLTDNTENLFIQTYLHKRLSGGESSRGLFKSNLTISPGRQEFIDWSPIYLDRISDPEFKLLFEKEDKQLYETKFYNYVAQLKSSIRIFWGNVECDRDYWGISTNVSNSLDYVPTILDPTKSRFLEKTTTGYNQVSSSHAWNSSYTNFTGESTISIGLTHRFFQPGVGYKDHLTTDIEIKDFISEQGKIVQTKVGPTKNNNSYIFFSGQR